MQDSLNRNMQLITLSGRPINDCTFSESAFIYTKTPCVSFWFLLFLLKKKKKNLSVSRKHNQVGDKAFSVKMPNRVLVSFKFLP